MCSHTVTVHVAGRDPGRITCPRGTSVLRAMVAAGLRHLPVGCRSGGCGVCRIRVDHGEYTLGRMSTAQVDDTAAANGIALACQLFPTSDLDVSPLGQRPGADTHPVDHLKPTKHPKENP